MVFFTSDHHFGHKNIIKYCNRPFSSVDDMNEVMINRWNRTVSPEDLVIHLGDFSLGPLGYIQSIVQQLNGKIILIRGNHDRHTAKKYKEAGFFMSGKKLWYNKDPIFFPEEKRDLRILLRHKPYPTPPDKDDDVADIILHGHVHTRWKRQGKRINVGVDQWNFYPVKLEDLLDATSGSCQLADHPATCADHCNG